MLYLQSAVEKLIDMLRAEVMPQVVMIDVDDFYEIKKTPSLILQGPKLTEHSERRTMDRLVDKDDESHEYQERNYPRFYHADFDLLLTTAKQAELFDLQHKILQFFQLHPWIELDDGTKLGLQELTPIGGLNKPNLSNLRQCSGVYRLEDVPVYDGIIQEGKLIKTAIFEVRDKPSEDAEIMKTIEVTEPVTK